MLLEKIKLKKKQINKLSSKQSEREEFKKEYLEYIAQIIGKPFSECSTLDKYTALATMVRDSCTGLRTETVRRRQEAGRKVVFYFSLEFLIGRLLENYLIQIGIRDMVSDIMNELGTPLEEILECEKDPGLGNGGLGRLAACFMDSTAAEDIPCVGMGIRYRYGLFKQVIYAGQQREEPDEWLADGYPWESITQTEAEVVPFGGRVDRRMENGRVAYELRDTEDILAIPYDVPILGYGGRSANLLRLWRAGMIHRQLDLEAFNNGDYSLAQKKNNEAEAISTLLYPADHTAAGQRLRLKQEYFFVCAGIGTIMRRFRQTGLPWSELPNRFAIHTNDTHPALCAPELMRRLMDIEGLEWNEAWDITCRTVSYTNHTVMPEALEKWPDALMRSLLPRIYQIIEEIDRRWRAGFDTSRSDWYKLWTDTAILYGGDVRMANLSIIAGHAVNGVAKLHTEILKDTVLHSFYVLQPEKFQNKTNGVSHRRFLLQSNPGLAGFITKRIGDGWITEPEQLERLLPYRDDEDSLRELGLVKLAAKERLCGYIRSHFGIDCDPHAAMDVQVKRIHAYKRQLLNAFKILALYDRLKDDPRAPVPSCTFVFAGKAAQSYKFAKDSISFVCAVADLVNSDPVVRDRIKVVFMENFGVSMAQVIYPAADISEQISTAGKEASGTGCMKFMMNGAVTLGTLDGANVEIADRVGRDNISIFGLTSEETERFTTRGGYSAQNVKDGDPVLSRVISHMTDGTLKTLFWDLQDTLIKHNDEFFVLKDFAPYLSAWDSLAGQVGTLDFQRKSLTNIAMSGWFSSDRTVREYADQIWHIQ
ncbi:MAG: glycogen/starch/alpha-glucan phosphorylase [Oscillospiraceae bacterium]|nr:glycogen/starch/alpha-glucan phosphorylase [Oscillospiraceae bacterium]